MAQTGAILPLHIFYLYTYFTFTHIFTITHTR